MVAVVPAAANRTVPMLLPFFFRSKSVCAVAAVPALTYESVRLCNERDRLREDVMKHDHLVVGARAHRS